MAQLIPYQGAYLLTEQLLEEKLQEISTLLHGRVKACYLFGSCATKKFRPDSDIDLILVAECQEPFVQRAFKFEDLLDVFPRMDFFVYTEEELSRLMNDSSNGFWLIVKATMRQIH
jgi:predicted nucleotidyltransferase